jgi:hypothetical protein
MRNWKKKTLAMTVAIVFLTTALTAPALAWDPDAGTEPGGVAMAGDLLIVRPLCFVGLVLGTVVFVVSSPFSAIGGNIRQAAEKLVKEPATYTFVRPLGEM